MGIPLGMEGRRRQADGGAGAGSVTECDLGRFQQIQPLQPNTNTPATSLLGLPWFLPALQKQPV